MDDSTIIVIQSGTGLVKLECPEHYLSRSVQYQCTVTGSNILQWRIRDENMTSLGTEAYTTSSDLESYTPINAVPQFSTDLSSTSPSLISNISFTVQFSINGYTIHCEDADGNAKQCTIEIAGTKKNTKKEY